ncbi:MAG: hypothetical protein WCJ87_13055 [Burkholderiales bacterium]
MANAGATTLTYDETTNLGSLASTFSSSGDLYAFSWETAAMLLADLMAMRWMTQRRRNT